MNKKSLSRIAALSIAAASAVSTLGMTASADVYQNTDGTTAIVDYVWKLTYTDANGMVITAWYDTEAHANSAATGESNKTVTKDYGHIAVGNKFNLGYGGLINKDSNGTITCTSASYGSNVSSSSSTDGYIDGIYISSSNLYATNYCCMSKKTGRYYPNYDALRQAEGSVSYEEKYINDSNQRWSSTKRYFVWTEGYYTDSDAANTVEVGRGYSYTGSYNISTSYRTSSTTVYKYGGVYYPNYNNMVASLGFTPSSSSYTTYTLSSSESYSSSRPYFDPHYGVYRSSTSGYSDLVLINSNSGTYTVYYSPYTQKYYDTWSAAYNATPSGYTVREITNSYYSASTLNTYGYSPYYYNGYYYGDYYYNGYYYGDYYYNGYYNPYYYYNYTTSSTNDTSTVTIGKYKGWTNVIRYINASRAGASYDVNMKSETSIPSNVLKALRGKNVTLNLKFNSGAVLSINGNDITSTDALNVNIKYDKNVPTSLAKKAVKANSGVSSAQFSISGNSLGASASVTIKFNTKRSGCDAKLYRYNASANSLSLVSNSSVKSNGSCTFDNVKQGGDYIIVLS